MEQGKIGYIDCLDAFHRLNDYLSQELEEPQIKEIRKHLDLCGHCAERYHFEESLLTTIRKKVQEETIPGTLRERLQALLDADSS